MLDWVKSAAAIREQVDGKVILITGGTGSWGKKMLHMLLTEFDPAKVIVFSRDELKQSVLSCTLLAVFHVHFSNIYDRNREDILP